jgi:TetR/AcrR family transcriptional regulator, ethionamide resistance regulator
VRRAILDATERLLAERRFDEINVAAILRLAGVSRASFYFYFESKHAVLAELVRRAVGEGHQAAGHWLERPDDEPPGASLREGTAAGVRLWKEKGPVLRAIVENWRTDEALARLWAEQMDSYTAAAAGRIARDRRAGWASPTTVDPHTLASALSWLGERAYYLAAIGVAPFDDEERLVDVLTEIWMLTVYGEQPIQRPPSSGGSVSGPDGASDGRS